MPSSKARFVTTEYSSARSSSCQSSNPLVQCLAHQIAIDKPHAEATLCPARGSPTRLPAPLGASSHLCHGPGDGEILCAHGVALWGVKPQPTLQQLVHCRQARRQSIPQTKYIKSCSLLGRKQNLEVFALPAHLFRHTHITRCN